MRGAKDTRHDFLSLNAHPRVAVDDRGKHRHGVYVLPLPDVWQVQAMALYAREQLHAQTAATLHDDRSSLGTRLAEAFFQAFVEKGGEIIEATTYSDPVVDYTIQSAETSSRNIR